MYPPEPPHPHYPTEGTTPQIAQVKFWADVALRVVAGLVTVAAGALWLFCAYLVLSFRIAPGDPTDPHSPAFDPHGFGIIFGSVLSLPDRAGVGHGVAVRVSARSTWSSGCVGHPGATRAIGGAVGCVVDGMIGLLMPRGARFRLTMC